MSFIEFQKMSNIVKQTSNDHSEPKSESTRDLTSVSIVDTAAAENLTENIKASSEKIPVTKYAETYKNTQEAFTNTSQAESKAVNRVHQRPKMWKMKIALSITSVFALGFIIFYFALPGERIKKDEGVLVLNSENFDFALTDNKHILVAFYAPWCGHCKALAPEYAKFAQKLATDGSPVKLAKVDAIKEQYLADKYDVEGYPTLKFFTNGKPSKYTGGRTSEEIFNWLLKKTGGAPAINLTNRDQSKAFIEGNEAVVIGFFKNQSSEKAQTFLSVAAGLDDVKFGITSDEGVCTDKDVVDDAIVLFKKFDDGRVDFDGEWTENSIRTFVQTESLPLVVELNPKLTRIFGGEIKYYLLVFVSKISDKYQKAYEAAEQLARDLRGKVIFLTVDADIKSYKPLIEHFEIKTTELPTMGLINLEDRTRYKPENPEFSLENTKSFIQAFLDNKLKPFLLSEEIPEDWNNGPVKVLVGKNFHKIAFDDTKDVLVEFYAPWCGHCKKLSPIYEMLAEKFKDNQSILVAKIDATANELENTKIQSFPTIKLYKKGDNKVVEYKGERTLEGMSKFIETGGVYSQAANNKEEEEENLQTKDEL